MVRLLYYNNKNLNDFIFSDNEDNIYWVDNRVFKPIEYDEIDIIINDLTEKEWTPVEMTYPSLEHIDFALKVIKRNGPNLEKFTDLVNAFKTNIKTSDSYKINTEYSLLIKDMSDAVVVSDGRFKDDLLILMNELKGVYEGWKSVPNEWKPMYKSLDELMYEDAINHANKED